MNSYKEAAELRVKLKKLIGTLAASTLLLACKDAPKRPFFLIGASEVEPVVPVSGPVVAPIPNPNYPPIVESQKTRNTMQKLMLSASDPAAEICKPESLKSRPSLRLLTKDEYQNSIQDILRVTVDYRAALPSESLVGGFRNNIDLGKISDTHATAYLETAINIGDEINPKLATLAGCAGALNEACAQKVIEVLGPRIWRRPIEVTEKDKLLKSYRAGAELSSRHGMTMLISRLLISPNFLYRSEIGNNGILTPFEMASALSFFFWGTAPDATLFNLAASGKLSDDVTLGEQAIRLFSDSRSLHGTSEFAKAWLDSQSVKGAIKDATMFPAFTPAIRAEMANETENTFDYLMRQPNAGFDSLFKNEFTIGSPALATYYGGQIDAKSQIKFSGSSRKGLLSLGGLLSLLATPKETHPIRRGNFVLAKLFCQQADPTPENLDVKIPEFDPTTSTRERFAKHTESKQCAECHLPIDGIGLGMEDFNSVGIYREIENGKKIDSSGKIINVDSMTTAFNGASSLSSYIATSKQARRCFVVQWYKLAHGYTERPEDICAIRDLANKFETGTMSLSQLLVAIMTHPSYRSKGQ